MDLYEFYSGRCFDAYNELGAHVVKENVGKSRRKAVTGVDFVTYAPNAESVTVTGEFNSWGETAMERCYDGSFFKCFVPGAKAGQMYKYKIYQRDGYCVDHCDPYGFGMELRPAFASIIRDMDEYTFGDARWMRTRNECKGGPLNVYEMHMGSWHCKPVYDENGKQLTPEEVIETDRVAEGWYTYREIAPMLVEYLKEQGYNYVEFMPLSEHPCDESWGYQNTGFFSPTARYGTADDLKFLIDTLHKNGIGAIMDYVPVHFALDGYGLAKYDGTNLYEHPTDDVGYSEWGSKNFIHSKGEVQTFLKSAANYWLTEYHFDGLRMDAISRIIYWMGDESRGVNDRAVEFIKGLNQGLKDRHPSCILCAEDSTDYKGTTKEVGYGGLGFDYKWDMGWMNDFLEYMKLDPYFRKDHQRQLCFSIDYYTSEKYILVLSHDEVVHGKCSLLNKMSGLEGDKFASLRAAFGFMYGHPGKKLLFMGQEFAQKREWAEFRSLDWFLLEEDDRHKKMQDYVRELNHLYQKYDALYYHDFNIMGFEWMDCWRPELSTVAFVRRGSSVKDQLMFIANFTPMALEDYQVNAPCAGTFTEILNSDEERFGGEGRVNKKPIQAKPCKAPVVPRPGEKIKPGKKYYELELYVPPLSVVVLRYDYKAE